MMGSPLVKYEEARAALAHCHKVDEAKSIRDKAEALRAYARQANDVDLELWMTEIKWRASKRIGELTRQLEKIGGPGRGKKTSATDKSFSKTEAIAAAGLTPQQAHRCEQIAAIPDEEFEEYIEEAREKKRPVSSRELLSKVPKRAKSKARIENIEEPDEECCQVEDLVALGASGRRFACIYADPPWAYSNQGTRAATKNHYPTMTVEEIAALPIGELAAEQSHLWLWTTNGFLFECPKIFEAWGFEFKSSYVWVKPQIGIGNYLRNSHELLLLATRGGLVGAARDVRSWGEFDRTEHSAKPEKIRSEVIEKVSPGPRLELFGRKSSHGWAVWGNQIGRSLFDGEVRKLA